jgi:ubiquinone/menaquinone biosynthesis C-methylase UbiE
MTDYFDIYQNHAAEYDLLVEREDFEQHLLPAIEGILPLAGLDVVETGAGTGRLTCMLAPFIHSLRAFDASQAMLDVAVQKLRATSFVNWEAKPADHRHLPVQPVSADLVISGWSLVYLAMENGDWQKELDLGLKEMERVLRPAGTSIIIETLGTGQETPLPPANMVAYLTYLEEQGLRARRSALITYFLI